MKNITTFIVLLISMFGYTQSQFEASSFLETGMIKTTYKNGKLFSSGEPVYTKEKKFTEVLNIDKFGESVISFKLKSQWRMNDHGGQLFEVYGHKMSDGSYRDVIGYHNSSGGLWAVFYKSAVYIFDNNLLSVYSAGELKVVSVLYGDDPVSREELLDYIKPLRKQYESKHESYNVEKQAESKENDVAKARKEDQKFDKFNITTTPCVEANCVSVGIELIYKNGEKLVPESVEYVLTASNYRYNVTGANYKQGGLIHYKKGESTPAGQYCLDYTRPPSEPDYLEVKVKNFVSGDDLSSSQYVLTYNKDISLGYSGNDHARKGYLGQGATGPTINLYVENITHSETGEKLILYTVKTVWPDDIYRSSEVKIDYIKLTPDSKLTIDYSGGDGNSTFSGGYKGGEAGKITLHIDDNVSEYKLEHFGKKGNDGIKLNPDNFISDEVQSSSSNSETNASSDKSDEFTIVNNTGSMIHLIDEGGNGEGSLNNGSSKTFDCDETIYQAKENGSGTWNVKGRLIADGDNVCGQTINFK